MKQKPSFAASGLGFGMALGVLLGAYFDQTAAGLCVGMGVGALVGHLYYRVKARP